MKKLIISLALVFAVLPGFAQGYEQTVNAAFAKMLYPYFDEVAIHYTKGFSTSVHLSFYTYGTMKTLYNKCPGEITAQASLSEKDYSAAKKGAANIRKLLLDAARDPKNNAAIYIARMFAGASPMIFRVCSQTNGSHYFDITLKDEEVFGVPFDQVDKQPIVRMIIDYLNDVGKMMPKENMRVSEDGGWLLYGYKRGEKKYRQDEAFALAQKLGGELFSATNLAYYERSKPYYYLVAPFGMGIGIEVLNTDTHEVSREWIYPEEVREFCLEEGHKYHGPYMNTWFLTLPDSRGAVVHEYSDCFALELWCSWYDLLGGEWTPERITSMIKDARKDSASPMNEIIDRCKSTGKPLQIGINSRFGLRFGGPVDIDEL